MICLPAWCLHCGGGTQLWWKIPLGIGMTHKAKVKNCDLRQFQSQAVHQLLPIKMLGII